MSDRVSLLRAILANPRDDLSRLVFADWLEEHGATDADAARVEFIRLGCRMKTASRFVTRAEGEWLEKHWKRLLASAVALSPGPEWVQFESRNSRSLRILFAWSDSERVIRSRIKAEFARGFAHRIEFDDGAAYRRLGAAVAAAEPLARLGPLRYLTPRDPWPHDTGVVTAGEWGPALVARLAGFDGHPTAGEKVYHPGAGGHGLHRAYLAMADAMTALAREANGLTPNPPEVA